jgi:hypothetical protein
MGEIRTWLQRDLAQEFLGSFGVHGISGVVWVQTQT